VRGGQRDPANPWDVYDVNGNRTIDGTDIVLVRSKFSPGGTRAGDLMFDRRPGLHLWAPGPPDGRVNAIDIALVRAAYSTSCLAPP
jgi:hypothetical protein